MAETTFIPKKPSRMTSKNSWKASKDKRDGNRFAALPHQVIDSPGYRQSGHTARSLLVDIFRQYMGNNNGRLVACKRYLKGLGWTSNDTVTRAKRELIDRGLLVETRKGSRQNVAGWYAVTWLALDHDDRMDVTTKVFERLYHGAYMHSATGVTAEGPSIEKIAVPVPSRGPRMVLTAPVQKPPHLATAPINGAAPARLAA